MQRPRYVYRAVRNDEGACIRPKNCKASVSLTSAVEDGAQDSQYVSCTLCPEVALYFAVEQQTSHPKASSGDTIVVIDLESCSVNSHDLSDGAKLETEKAKNFAKREKLVLLEGTIPAEAVVKKVSTTKWRAAIQGAKNGRSIQQFKDELPVVVRKEVQASFQQHQNVPRDEDPRPGKPVVSDTIVTVYAGYGETLCFCRCMLEDCHRCGMRFVEPNDDARGRLALKKHAATAGFLSDAEIERWFEDVFKKKYGKHMHPEVLEAGPFQKQPGQFKKGTKIEYGTWQCEIIGSKMQNELEGIVPVRVGRADDSMMIPVYVCRGLKTGELETLEVLSVHDSPKIVGEFETLVESLPTIPSGQRAAKNNSVLFVGLEEFELEYYEEKPNWGATRTRSIENLSEIDESSSLFDYQSVILSDAMFDRYRTSWGPQLKRYFDGGGILIVPAMGTFSVPSTLSTLLGCDWEFDAYTREEMRTTEYAWKLFGAEAGEWTLDCCKCNMLRVPHEEALVRSHPKQGEGGYANLVSAALHRGEQGGVLAYFGCGVNFEEEFVDMIQAVATGTCDGRMELD